MKRFTLPVLLCGLLTVSMYGQQKATPVTASGIPSHSPIIVPANLVICEGVLPNYTNGTPDPAGGVTCQDFNTEFDLYDNMAADDFVASGSGDVSICQVSVTGTFDLGGFAADPDSQAVLRIFEDNAGLPGTEVYTESFPGSVDDNNDGSFVLDLVGSPSLIGGTTYWLSVQAKMNIGLAGQWFWDTASDGNGLVYAWQNPNGGFGMCMNWTLHTSCSLPQGADLIMDISFNSVLGTNSNVLDTAISIFPNPAKSQFTLRSDVLLKKLAIFDISGRMVNNVDLTKMANEKTIDISGLVSGVYLLQITSEKGTVIKQLLKE